jgi:anti-sigma-K factor RskA
MSIKAVEERLKNLRREKAKRVRRTTLWVSTDVWRYINERKELGESVDATLRRLLGIQKKISNDEVSNARA